MRHELNYAAFAASLVLVCGGQAFAQSPQRDDNADNSANDYATSLPYRDYLAGGNLRTSEVVGKTVRNAEGRALGEVEELLVDPDKDMQLIVAVGGFLGLGEKLVAIPYQELRVSASGDQLFVNRSEAQLEAAPAFDYDAESERMRTSGIQRGTAERPTAATQQRSGQRPSTSQQSTSTTRQAGDSASSRERFEQDAGDARERLPGQAANRQRTEAGADGEGPSERFAQDAGDARRRDLDDTESGRTAQRSTAPAQDSGERSASSNRPAGGASANATQTTLRDNDHRVTEIIGAKVVDGSGKEIAEVDDLVVSTDRKQIQAVLSVGGIAGVGEKLVAVALDDLKILPTTAGRQRLDELQVQLDMTPEQLQARPEFSYESAPEERA